MTVLRKDPQATLDYGFDWSRWLGTDTIATSAWTVPSGLVGTNEASTDTTTTVWLSGGVAGMEYRVTNAITTAGGRTEQRTMLIQVEER